MLVWRALGRKQQAHRADVVAARGGVDKGGRPTTVLLLLLLLLLLLVQRSAA